MNYYNSFDGHLYQINTNHLRLCLFLLNLAPMTYKTYVLHVMGQSERDKVVLSSFLNSPS